MKNKQRIYNVSERQTLDIDGCLKMGKTKFKKIYEGKSWYTETIFDELKSEQEKLDKAEKEAEK